MHRTTICPPRQAACREEHDARRNWPATPAEATEAGYWWPEGLRHQGAPPKTLRELLTGEGKAR